MIQQQPRIASQRLPAYSVNNVKPNADASNHSGEAAKQSTNDLPSVAEDSEGFHDELQQWHCKREINEVHNRPKLELRERANPYHQTCKATRKLVTAVPASTRSCFQKYHTDIRP